MIQETIENFKPRNYFGKKEYYRDALYNCLVQLNPNNCLEIGTHRGASTGVFQHYIDGYNKNAKLLTCDTHYWEDRDKKMLHGHGTDVLFNKDHKNIKRLIVKSYNKQNDNIDEILEYNKEIIKNNMIDKFNFVFIDGDHSYNGLKNDFNLINDLISYPCYILLDDCNNGSIYQCEKFFEESIKNNKNCEFYYFDDWKKNVQQVLVKINSKLF